MRGVIRELQKRRYVLGHDFDGTRPYLSGSPCISWYTNTVVKVLKVLSLSISPCIVCYLYNVCNHSIIVLKMLNYLFPFPNYSPPISFTYLQSAAEDG